MTEITLHNITDVYMLHQKNTDAGTWMEFEIQDKDGIKTTIAMWSCREKSSRFHFGDEE